MGLFFESRVEREAREAAHRAKVRNRTKQLMDRDAERKARKDAAARYVLGIWKAG